MRRSSGSTAVRLLVFVCATGLVAGANSLSALAGGTSLATGTSSPVAKASRTVALAETGHLSFDPLLERGSAIGERGQATGTYNAPVEAFLTIHAHYVTAEITVHPKGGSISGSANAHYIVTGSVGSFHGTLVLTRGTGTFKHISGNLGFEGAINHQNFRMWLVAKGLTKY